MKVLNKPDVSKWSHVHICTNCECKLELGAKDIFYKYVAGDTRDPGYDSWNASCIVCNEAFSVLVKDIPKLLQVEIKARSARNSSNYFEGR